MGPEGAPLGIGHTPEIAGIPAPVVNVYNIIKNVGKLGDPVEGYLRDVSYSPKGRIGRKLPVYLRGMKGLSARKTLSDLAMNLEAIRTDEGIRTGENPYAFSEPDGTKNIAIAPFQNTIYNGITFIRYNQKWGVPPDQDSNGIVLDYGQDKTDPRSSLLSIKVGDNQFALQLRRNVVRGGWKIIDISGKHFYDR